MASEGDLAARFVRELEAVGGHAHRAGSDLDAANTIAVLARSEGVRGAAFGQGIASDLVPSEDVLRRAGIEVTRVGRVEDSERPVVRAQIARCDLGVAEAGYGIASTGTLAVTADADHPGALTLLPPISVVVLHADRIVSDLAALFEALGPAVAASRLTLITGPSRTADIEKRIVMGVHGPRQLHVVLIGPA